MKPQNILNGILIIGLIGIGLYVSGNQPQAAQANPSVYDRIMRTHTLRCGTFEEPPFTILDVNTNKRTGIAVELAERIAHDLNLKLEWVPISNFTTISEDLRLGRYDAICASVFNLPRAGTIDYTTQYIYVPVYAYTQAARANNFTDITKIDWHHTNVIGMDGEGATTIARQRLPQAKFTILPDMSSISEMLTSLADNKGDVAFVIPTVFANYDINNPGKLQKSPGNAFHVFPVSFAIKPDEFALKDTFDTIIRNLMASGELDGIIHRYDPNQLLYRVAKPYEAMQ